MEKANDRLSQEVIKNNIIESYRIMNKFYGESEFLNHGYYDPSTGYSNQENLYYHLVRDIDISNLDILDIGCGHGGGLNLLHNKLGCKSAIGVDISPENISFCQNSYGDTIKFMQGDAEDLQFEDNSFDIVFNIESAHCYPNYDKFLNEVVRVLRPGALFLFTDAISESSVHNRDEISIYLVRKFPGLELISETDITEQVADSCKSDMDNSPYWIVRKIAKEKFTGYSSKESKHLSFVCRKVG